MILTKTICNNNFYVITGGPGVGKTTLLTALEKRNFTCVPEVAREIIKEQMNSNGDALPWKNRELYTQLMLDRSVDRYTAMDSWNNGQLTFFDRGILDTLCYARLIEIDITATMDHYAKHYTYNPTVFILPPWADIYETDNERKQTWEEAVQTYEVMSDTYRLYGYEVIEVPRIAIEDRLAFVLGKIE